MLVQRDQKKINGAPKENESKSQNHAPDISPFLNALASVASRKDSEATVAMSSPIVASASAAAAPVMLAAKDAPQPDAPSVNEGEVREEHHSSTAVIVVAPSPATASATTATAVVKKSDSKSVSSITTSTTGTNNQRITYLIEIPAIIADAKINSSWNKIIPARLAAAYASDADLNEKSQDVTADFPLKLAVNPECPIEVLDWLLDMKQHPKRTVDVNLEYDGTTALMMAVAYEDPHLYSAVASTQDSKIDQKILDQRKRVDLLLQNSADPWALKGGVLERAARSKNVNFIDRVLKHYCSGLKAVFSDFTTILCVAIENNDELMIDRILDYQKKWNKKDSTAILKTAMIGKSKISHLKKLIAAGVQAYQLDQCRSVLMQAFITYKNKHCTLTEANEIIQCILQEYKNKKTQITFKMHDLYFAIDQGWDDIVKILTTQYSLDPSQPDDSHFGKSYWHHASMRHYTLETSLERAAWQGNINTVRTLTDAKQSKKMPKLSLKALQVAVYRGYIDVVKYLVALNIQFRVTDFQFDYCELNKNRMRDYFNTIHYININRHDAAKVFITCMNPIDRNDLFNLYQYSIVHQSFIEGCRKELASTNAKQATPVVIPPPAESPDYKKSNEGQSSAIVMKALPEASAPAQSVQPVVVVVSNPPVNDNKNDFMSNAVPPPPPKVSDTKSIAVLTQAAHATPAHFQPGPQPVAVNDMSQANNETLSRIAGMLDVLLLLPQTDAARVQIGKLKEEVIMTKQKLDEANKGVDISPA